MSAQKHDFFSALRVRRKHFNAGSKVFTSTFYLICSFPNEDNKEASSGTVNVYSTYLTRKQVEIWGRWHLESKKYFAWSFQVNITESFRCLQTSPNSVSDHNGEAKVNNQ